MSIDPSEEFALAAPRGAVFASLRATLAREVSSSAMLADLLEKLNRMQEAQAWPPAFKERFDAFVARAAEYEDVVGPFLPILERFLPSDEESLVCSE